MKDKEFFEFIKKTCNNNLTNEQKEAILYNETHHSIMSTAGSGKTSVLCIKLAYLILVKHISPKKIVVVSFSRNSAADIEERFNTWFGNIISDKISFSTIHSFAYKIIRDKERKSGIRYTVIENNKPYNKKSILSDLYKKYNNEKINEDQLKGLESFITYVRNMMIYKSTMNSLEDRFPVPYFIEIYEEYSRILIDNHFLDYDTQLVMAHHILSKNADILAKYQRMYSFYLVDESQDNSKIQNEILKLLSQKGTICYVGDTDQRIYSWRGADERFDNFKQLYPNSKILFMDQNFRSTSSIVNLANKFIKCNKNRYDKEIYTNNEKGEKVNVLSAKNEKDQLDIIINSIKENTRPYGDYAILYRNNISAISVLERLNNENIPFSIKDEVSSFFNNFIVNDVLNFVRFAINPTDLDSFRQIYYKTMSYIPKKAIDMIPANLNENIIDELLYSHILSKGSSNACKSLKDNFIKLSIANPSSILDIIQYDMHYYEYLESYSEKNNYSMENMDNIISALQGILESLKDIREIEWKLSNIRDLMRSSTKNKNNQSVSLSSFHSSKGLEWDEVFIIDTQMIPSKSSIKNSDEGINDEYEEEIRTFFVAITRPKKKLTIIEPRSKNHQFISNSEFFTFCLENTSDFLKLKDIELENLHEGMSICHKTFGQSYISKIYPDGLGDIVTATGQVKKISFKICISKNLIKY